MIYVHECRLLGTYGDYHLLKGEIGSALEACLQQERISNQYSKYAKKMPAKTLSISTNSKAMKNAPGFIAKSFFHHSGIDFLCYFDIIPAIALTVDFESVIILTVTTYGLALPGYFIFPIEK